MLKVKFDDGREMSLKEFNSGDYSNVYITLLKGHKILFYGIVKDNTNDLIGDLIEKHKESLWNCQNRLATGEYGGAKMWKSLMDSVDEAKMRINYWEKLKEAYNG